MKTYREQALDLATGYSSGLHLLKGSGFFDLITHAGIYNYLTYEDLILLNELAINPAYTIKSNRSKFWLYDQIIVPRGFSRTHSGTNRVVYSNNNDKSFIIKVALDRIGVNDNKFEFKNQNILKPFVPKVFDVSECGTVALMERVQPILNREQFSMYADSIFNILAYIIDRGYILEDIGTDFFMNWGIRQNFGPVLLDFPYIYRVNKYRLKCIRRNIDGSICGGQLEYDDGFNYILCKKCGKRYPASNIGSNFSYLDEIKKKLRRTQSMSFKLKITTNGKNVVNETGTSTINENYSKKIIDKINNTNNNISTGGGYDNPITKHSLKISSKALKISKPEEGKKVIIPNEFKKNSSKQYTKYIPSVNTIEARVVECLKTNFNMTLDDIDDELSNYLKKYFIDHADKFLERKHFITESVKIRKLTAEEYENFKESKVKKVLHTDKYKIIETGIFTDFIANYVFFNSTKFIKTLIEAIELYNDNNSVEKEPEENKKEEVNEQPVKQEEVFPKKLEMELNSSPLANPVVTQESATDIVAERVNNGTVVKEKLSDDDF